MSANRVLLFLGDADAVAVSTARRRRQRIVEICDAVRDRSAGTIDFHVATLDRFIDGDPLVTWCLGGDTEHDTFAAELLAADRFLEMIANEMRSFAERLLTAAAAVEGGAA